jgi:hypothetical protein
MRLYYVFFLATNFGSNLKNKHEFLFCLFVAKQPFFAAKQPFFVGTKITQ